jgi:hypothetical protein
LALVHDQLMKGLDAHQVRQQVPGFPYRRYEADDLGEPVEYELGEIDLTRAVIQDVFSLPDSANEIYRRPAASAQDWERAEPRGILTPSWQEVEDQIASGTCPPLVVRAQADGSFLLLDGHHRASMARHLGIERMSAFVDYNGIERRPRLAPLEEAPPVEVQSEAPAKRDIDR